MCLILIAVEPLYSEHEQSQLLKFLSEADLAAGTTLPVFLLLKPIKQDLYHSHNICFSALTFVTVGFRQRAHELAISSDTDRCTKYTHHTRSTNKSNHDFFTITTIHRGIGWIDSAELK